MDSVTSSILTTRVDRAPSNPGASPDPSASSPGHDKTVLADMGEGWSAGQYRVFRRLSKHRLLAVPQNPESAEREWVVLTQLDVPEENLHTLVEHARLAAQLDLPQTAKVLPAEATEDGAYWVTACIPGVTLQAISAKCKAEMKTLPLGVCLGIIHDAALGAAAVHGSPLGAHGLLHPGSIQVSFEGPVHLLNVGLVRSFSIHRQRSQWLDAMAPYLPPESLALGCVTDPQSDVFVLAAVLFEAVTGTTLFHARTFQERTKLPPMNRVPTLSHLVLKSSLDAVLRKALNPDRSQRYPHAKAFANALQEAVGEYIWKKEQRADFISRLFSGRAQAWENWQSEINTPPPATAESAPPPLASAPAPSPVAPGLTAALTGLKKAPRPTAPSRTPPVLDWILQRPDPQRRWALAGAALLLLGWILLPSTPAEPSSTPALPPTMLAKAPALPAMAQTAGSFSEPWGPDSVGELRKSLALRAHKRTPSLLAHGDSVPDDGQTRSEQRTELRAKRVAAWRARQETARSLPPWLRGR